MMTTPPPLTPLQVTLLGKFSEGLIDKRKRTGEYRDLSRRLLATQVELETLAFALRESGYALTPFQEQCLKAEIVP